MAEGEAADRRAAIVGEETLGLGLGGAAVDARRDETPIPRNRILTDPGVVAEAPADPDPLPEPIRVSTPSKDSPDIPLQILELSVLGYTPEEVSEVTGVSERIVTMTIQSPLAQLKMQAMEMKLADRIAQATADGTLHERILGGGKIAAARTLVGLLSRDDVPAVQHKAAVDILEFPPNPISKKVTSEVVHRIELPAEAAARLSETLSMLPIIEAEVLGVRALQEGLGADAAAGED